MIVNRFSELLDAKRWRDMKAWYYKDVAAATGIEVKSVRSWARAEVSFFDARLIVRFCEFFECEIDDLLVHVEEE